MQNDGRQNRSEKFKIQQICPKKEHDENRLTDKSIRALKKYI